jgi:hypothetical protein
MRFQQETIWELSERYTKVEAASVAKHTYGVQLYLLFVPMHACVLQVTYCQDFFWCFKTLIFAVKLSSQFLHICHRNGPKWLW